MSKCAFAAAFLLVSACFASTHGQTCSVLEEITKISPSYAAQVAKYSVGIGATREDLDGSTVAKTFFVPTEEVYGPYVKNITFGFGADGEQIFNVSVLIQTSDSPLTLSEMLGISEDFSQDGGQTFGGVPSYLGYGADVAVQNDTDNPSVVYADGPEPEGDLACLLYRNCFGNIIRPDVPACNSIIHVLDNPLEVPPNYVAVEATPEALNQKCPACADPSTGNALSCDTAEDCSCCNIYI